ncbi:hypothetical protein Tco_0044416 [Tanacetum coccineum]
MTRGYGVGGRLVCAVKDGSMMAVVGVSIREVASHLQRLCLLQKHSSSTSVFPILSSDDEIRGSVLNHHHLDAFSTVCSSSLHHRV